jgi:hypothetical protein
MKDAERAMHPGQATCGAKTRKGSPCKDIAMANGRCKRHGGKATGAKNPHKSEGSTNGAYTHGIYTKYLRPEEKALIDEGAIRLGQVDDELQIVRIRLKRTLEAKEKWEAEARGDVDGATEETSLVLVEHTEGEAPGPDGTTIDVEKKVRKLPSFDDLIDRCLARIESLEKTRRELMKPFEGDDPDDPDAEPGRDHVTFSGGLEGEIEGELPSPFSAASKAAKR